MRSQTAEFVGASGRPEDLLGDGRPEIVFAGRSNVGKSSLLNRLFGARLARTSSTPGRTQTINWFRARDGFWLVDLPGFGYAKASKQAREGWARLIAAYLERQAPRLVIQLVDAKVGATALDVEAGRYLAGKDVARLVVATKADRLKQNQREPARRQIARALDLGGETDLLFVSAVSGEGVRELWKRITQFLAQ